MIADSLGATSAVICAITLLPQWLREDDADFEWIFGFPRLCLAFRPSPPGCSARSPTPTTSRRSRFGSPLSPPGGRFAKTPTFAGWELWPHSSARRWSSFRTIRRLPASSSPRLQLSRLVGGGPETSAPACSGILTGPLADRFGNRLSLRILTLLIAAAPQLALILVQLPGTGGLAFAMVFFLVV